MTGAAVASACRLLCGTSVQWHCDPWAPVQRIYFGNHSSHLDFIAIWSALPADVRPWVRPVAARDYWEQNVVRRHLARNVFNAVLVDRRNAATPCATAAARAVTSYLADQMGRRDSLILFPEGTRGEDGRVGTFRSGLYFLSRLRPDAELIPVYLENLNRILPKGESLPVPMLSRLILGQPLQICRDENKQQFLEKARAAVVQLGAAA